MTDQPQDILPTPQHSVASPTPDWRPRVLLIGGALGAVLGLLSALIYIRSVQEAHGQNPPPEPPRARDALRLGMSLLGIVRSIAEWGRR